MVALTVPFGPSANRYWRKARNGALYVSEEAQSYKAEVGWLCRAAGMEPVEGYVKVTLNVYRNTKARDFDNSIKVTLDALQGHAYNNDKQVREIHLYGHEDYKNPRIELEIEAL